MSSPFSSGTLWQKVQAQTEYAFECGALQSIPTQYEFLDQDGVSFLVRSLDTLARKEKAKQQQKKAAASGKPQNPFLPYEEDLFVDFLSDTHLCLLNKFNVVDYHLLIVTRAFEEQETWLNQRDFEALGQCMAEIDGLAFYNGGPLAGASQPHKHLQLVPMPLSPHGHPIPIEAVMVDVMTAALSGEEDNSMVQQTVQPTIHQLKALPFTHRITPLAIDTLASSEQIGLELLNAYLSLLNAVGVERVGESDRQTLPYNLLATRRWMMIVPRSQEHYASISVNSLGFAGSLFVKDEEHMQILKQTGPMNVLKHVALPKAI